MTPPPDIWSCRAVELAVRTLPPQHRERYGLEFIAELYGMPRRQQRRHSVRVLIRAWALRTALTGAAPGTIEERAVKDVQARPLSCRLNMRHTWRWFSTEDGDRYCMCARCKKDKPDRYWGNTIGA